MNFKYFTILIVALIIIGGFIWYMKKESIQEPKFISIKKDGDFEIRQYHPMVVARIKQVGLHHDVMSNGFKELFQYINGQNKSKSEQDGKLMKIDMMIPVMQKTLNFEIDAKTLLDNKQNWYVEFIMPEKFTLNNLPVPNSNEIELVSLPEKTYIVLNFEGNVNDQKILSKLSELKNYFTENNFMDYKIVKDTQVLAFYNSPWILPILKHNEIMIELVKEKPMCAVDKK